MKTKEEIVEMLKEIENTCSYCEYNRIQDNEYCFTCDHLDSWELSTEKALEIAERILE